MRAEKPKIEIGYGFGKGEDAFILGAEVARQALAGIKEHPLSGVLVFASVRYDLVELLKGIYSLAGDVPMFGTTTAGEICDGVLHESVVIVALASPYLKVGIGWGEGVSEDWQRAVTQAVSTPELSPFFSPRDSTIWPELTRQGKSAFALLFSPGNTRYNDSHSFEILEELKRLSGGRLPIFGGSSADDWRMEENYVFVGQRVYRDAVVVAVFETTLRFGIGLAHGLQPSSRRATITRAQGHELLELDGKPAADVYAEMLGTTRVALEGWHLTLSTGQPAGILDPYGQYSINVASYFTPQGAVRFAQPVLEGTVLTIMEANQDSMITAGQEALRKATLRGQITQPVVALVCSCALRTQFLRERTQEELVGMKRIMPDIPLVGFYGFGEQGVADDGVNRHTYEAITMLVLGQELSFGAQLQHSEEKYRALIETTDTGYLIVDSEGRVLDANPEYVRLTGHAILQEILGRKVTEWTAEHDLARNASKIRECLSRGFVRNLEIDYIDKHEQLTPIEINATVLGTTDSLKIVALCRDITERKRAEEALRESEERYRSLFELESDALFLIENETGRILEVNAAAEDLYGYHRKELLQMKNTDLSAEAVATRAATLEGRKRVPIRFHRKQDGSVFPVDITVRHFQWQKSGVCLAAIRDITEQLRAQQEIEKQRSFLRTVIDADPHFVYVKNRYGQIILANQSLAARFGFTLEQLVGHEFSDFMVDSEFFRTLVDDDTAILTLVRDRIEREAKCVDQTGKAHWFYTVEAPIKNEAGEVEQLIGVSIDITERKRMEAALFEAKERAQVTLHSIGDAVITTDAAGIVQYLNPVAEALTDWSVDEAQGRSLTEVFTIIDEDTRQPAPDPVARCLREGKITGLANHTCLLSRTGQDYAIQDSAAPIHSRDGEILGVVVVFSDITSSRRLAQVMSYQAAHDSLTGLINRQEFERRLQRVLKTVQTEDSEHVLGYLDLDQFKVVNDTGGHVAGDELLRQLSELLQNQLRKRDTLARLGGDEFGLILEHCSIKQARRVAETLRQAVENFRFFWEGRIFNVGVSIGLVPINQASENLAEVLSAADAACYIAKEQGRNRIHIYQTDDTELAQRHGEMQWAVQLPRALEEGRLRLWWQPIAPLSAHEQAGEHYELLLRLEDETGHLVLPGTFLPAAERYNLATRLDRWVFSTILQWLAQHPDQLQHLSLCTINLSGHSLGEKAFLEFVLEQLATTGIPTEKLCFEITETVAIANLVNATRFINALKARGCRFALDDFGSGLSSFAYLKTLPVDYVKIDGAFVKDIATEPTSFAIVKAMHEIAQIMGKQTIAEFVESALILEKLHEIGVDYAQGYFIGRPQPLQH